MSKRLVILIAVFAVLAAFSFSASGVAIYQRFNQTNVKRAEAAKKATETTTSLRILICYFASQDPRPGSVRVYAHALELIHARPCSN